MPLLVHSTARYMMLSVTSVVEFCGQRAGHALRNLDLQVQSGYQNQWVHIVLEVSKSEDAKGDVPNICGFMQPAAMVIMHSLESM